MTDTFLERVKNTIEKYQMLAVKDVVLVGVSGGPDSVALLNILFLLKEKYQLNLFVVHVNHMFRGMQAQREAEFVAELAESRGLGYRIFERDVPKLIREEGLSPQEAGHRVRKQIFQQLGQEIGAQKLALGHHAEDRAETVLLHIIQGTGLEGLAGMLPVSGWTIRPLAQTYKDEIINYCKENGLTFYLDPSNKKPVYLRNKIRLELLPYLKKELNPQIVESLVKLENIAAEDNRFLDELTEKLLPGFLISSQKGKLILSTVKLNGEHLALQRRILRKVYNVMRPEEQGLSFNHVERLLELCQAAKGAKQLNLPRAIVVKKNYDYLEFLDEEVHSPEKTEGFTILWEIPGRVELHKHITFNAFYTSTKPIVFKDFYQVTLDGDKIRSPLIIRQRKPGDRIKPLGMEGTKKLKDIFIDQKIAKEVRDEVPIVCCGEEIIWLPGITMHNDYKVSSNTKCYLNLELVKDEYV
ncbi:MAG: hypothetical protein VR72_20020 [Clostridiaceae bacterium BRH_c20a]|nr:MAG: hypothetical protein VR72_20020 [Clostridiaceae bacterium BRH_c20a]